MKGLLLSFIFFVWDQVLVEYLPDISAEIPVVLVCKMVAIKLRFVPLNCCERPYDLAF